MKPIIFDVDDMDDSDTTHVVTFKTLAAACDFALNGLHMGWAVTVRAPFAIEPVYQINGPLVDVKITRKD